MKFKPLCWHLPRPSASKYPGAYSLNFENKFRKFIGYSDFLHLFSGRAKTGFKVDLKIENKPNIVADCHSLPFKDNSFPVVLADPPYDDEYAERLYKTPPLRVPEYIKEMVRVCQSGGIVVLYHLWLPRREVYPKGCKYLGLITIVTGFGNRVRVCSFFKKDGKGKTLDCYY